MAKFELEFVKVVTTRGKAYYYFNTGKKNDAGNPIRLRLPDPTSANFFSVYGALKAVRTKQEKATQFMTIKKLIDLYEVSPKYKALSRESQRIYSLTLRKIEDVFHDQKRGFYPAEMVERKDIVYYMDTHTDTPGAANTFMDVVKALYWWGRDRGHVKADPTREVKKLPTNEHEPWPERLLERGLECDIDRVRLAVHLLYFTGQRIGDVVNMRWGDIDGKYINVIQKKTGKDLGVPIHSRLQAELNRTPRKGFYILGRHDGRKIGPQPIRIALKKFAGDYVPHGLRKNAVIALLEAGCSADQAGAITGQGPQMIQHYSKKINQRRLGDAAILMWENKG